MKPLICSSSFVIILLWTALLPAGAQVNVTQEHNNLSRDGLYIDAAFTPGNAATLTRDLNFDGTIVGHVYAQPLYIEGGPNGPLVIAVTQSNNVYALNATTGTVIWQRNNLGAPVPQSDLLCGDIDPVGITGTPVVDLASRALFLDALTTPDGGATIKHLIYSLNVNTGATNPNWPVDVNATAHYNGTSFMSAIQEERGGLALVNGIVYVPYSGYDGDCGPYHGWVVGVEINNPSTVMAWATAEVGGGIWGHGGVASDGTNMFLVTGNTFTTQNEQWSGGEAIVRFQAGPVFSDFWAPLNWHSLDNSDTDLGGVSATLVDVLGATPSQLVLGLGKDGNAYLVDRNNLGGVRNSVAQASVSGIPNRGTSAVTYHTSQGTYFAFHNDGSTISAYKVTVANPPMIVSAWSASQNGRGSPWVTTTDGTHNAIVWVAGVEGDQRLHAYNGDTGAVIYSGGGPNEQMTGTRQWNTGMVARGRIYFGADNKVYAFTVPTGTPTPTPTPTVTPTATPTPIPTATATPTVTPTPTPALRRLTYTGGTPFVNGTNLTRGTRYTVTAQANTSTRSVVFKKDGVVVKRDSATPFDFTWTPMVIGTHTFIATPWSSIGGTGTSGASITVRFRVVAASPSPTPTPAKLVAGKPALDVSTVAQLRDLASALMRLCDNSRPQSPVTLYSDKTVIVCDEGRRTELIAQRQRLLEAEKPVPVRTVEVVTAASPIFDGSKRFCENCAYMSEPKIPTVAQIRTRSPKPRGSIPSKPRLRCGRRSFRLSTKLA